jgi:hypothetical protein
MQLLGGQVPLKVNAQPSQSPRPLHLLKRRGGWRVLMMMMTTSLWSPRRTLRIVLINPLKVGLHFIILAESTQR